jgi:hypothetical protein
MSQGVTLETAAPGRKPAKRLPQAAKRLRKIRVEAGFRYSTEAAAAMRVNHITYNQHERGSRPLTVAAARKYAAFFKVSASWLLHGEATYPHAMVLVVGRIGDDGRVTPERYRFSDVRGIKRTTQGSAQESLASIDRAASTDLKEKQFVIDLFSRKYPESAYSEPVLLSAPPGLTIAEVSHYGAIIVDTHLLEPIFFRDETIYYKPQTFDAARYRARLHNRRCVVLTSAPMLFAGVVMIADDHTVSLMATSHRRPVDLGTPLAIWPIVGVECPDP